MAQHCSFCGHLVPPCKTCGHRTQHQRHTIFEVLFLMFIRHHKVRMMFHRVALLLVLVVVFGAWHLVGG